MRLASELTHVIGAKAGHNYTAEGKRIVNAKIDAMREREAEVKQMLADDFDDGH